MEEILKQIQLIEGMGLDTRAECFMQLQQVKKLKQLVEQQLKNCNLQNVSVSLVHWIKTHPDKKLLINSSDYIVKLFNER